MLARFKIPVGWGELLKRTFSEAIADDILNLAAQQAYYFFFALFPALLALVSFASFFPLYNLTDELFKRAGDLMPPEVLEMITTQLAKLSEQNAGGLLTIAFFITLWSSSGAVVSLCTTLNAAYDITEGRPWWKVRLIAIGLTIGLSVFILVSMFLVLAGPSLATYLGNIGLGSAFEWTWKILQWPIVLMLVATAIAMLYYFAPDAKQSWVWITPGSVVATLLWLAVSLGFKVYIANFGSYTETYGVIGGVMMLLLWFYLSGIAILLGAELNAEIEHSSPYGKDVGEKVPGEKKAIGALAEQEYEERKARGEEPVLPFRDGDNCDIDRRSTEPASKVRASDLLIGTMALLPAALKIGRDTKRKLAEDDRAA
jgi:membrane protein